MKSGDKNPPNPFQFTIQFHGVLFNPLSNTTESFLISFLSPTRRGVGRLALPEKGSIYQMVSPREFRREEEAPNKALYALQNLTLDSILRITDNSENSSDPTVCFSIALTASSLAALIPVSASSRRQPLALFSGGSTMSNLSTC